MTDSVLALPATLTQAQARTALLQLQQRIAALPTAAAVQMDASALASFDSSAIAVMLECRRTALAAGRSFAVLGAPPTITSLARLYGVAGLLGI